MKKFSPVILFSVFLTFVLFSCDSKFKKNGIEQALELNAKVFESEIVLYDKAVNGTEILRLSNNQKVKFLEFSKNSEGKSVSRVLFIDENEKKYEGWCLTESLIIDKEDYEKIASDCLTGLDYTYELLGPYGAGKITDLGHCKALFSNMIEITHEKKVDVKKLIRAINRIKNCASAFFVYYEDDRVDSPLCLAAKYNYYQLFTDSCFLPLNYDYIYQPDGLTIPAYAVKNNSNEVLKCFLLNNYFDGNSSAGNGQTLYELACSVNNNEAKEILSASLDQEDYIDAVNSMMNIKDEPKDKKYEWNVCKAMKDESFGKDSFDAYIKADVNTKINIRKEPDVNSEKTGAVFNNSIVKVYKMSDDKSVIDGTASNWLYIKSSENIEGWIFGDFVYVERSEKPPVKINDDVEYYFYYDNRNSFLRCDTKIVYQNLEEEILKAGDPIFILKSFESAHYSVIEDGCCFDYLFVRTKEGKVGVISSRDVANVSYQTYRYDESIYRDVIKSKLNITMMEPGDGKQKIYKINYVDPDGKSEELFLPGSHIYENGIYDIQIKYYSDSKTKKEYPVIAITEKSDSEDTDEQKSRVVNLYTVKDGRMYFFEETDTYEIEDYENDL